MILSENLTRAMGGGSRSGRRDSWVDTEDLWFVCFGDAECQLSTALEYAFQVLSYCDQSNSAARLLHSGCSLACEENRATDVCTVWFHVNAGLCSVKP